MLILQKALKKQQTIRAPKVHVVKFNPFILHAKMNLRHYKIKLT